LFKDNGAKSQFELLKDRGSTKGVLTGLSSDENVSILIFETLSWLRDTPSDPRFGRDDVPRISQWRSHLVFYENPNSYFWLLGT